MQIKTCVVKSHASTTLKLNPKIIKIIYLQPYTLFFA